MKTLTTDYQQHDYSNDEIPAGFRAEIETLTDIENATSLGKCVRFRGNRSIKWILKISARLSISQLINTKQIFQLIRHNSSDIANQPRGWIAVDELFASQGLMGERIMYTEHSPKLLSWALLCMPDGPGSNPGSPVNKDSKLERLDR